MTVLEWFSLHTWMSPSCISLNLGPTEQPDNEQFGSELFEPISSRRSELLIPSVELDEEEDEDESTELCRDVEELSSDSDDIERPMSFLNTKHLGSPEIRLL